MQSENHRIRESLSSKDLDNQFQEISRASDLDEKDAGTALSWIRAVRDECSAALRKASDSGDLMSRMIEFELRSGLFELLSRREPERARRQKLQGELLSHLQSFLVRQMEEDASTSGLLSRLKESMVELLPSLSWTSETHSPESLATQEPDGPLLVVESEYRGEEQKPDQGEEVTAPTDSALHTMNPAETDSSADVTHEEEDAKDEEELETLRAENQQLRQKLNDFLEEWGEGIRIDGKTVSILTHRKIIVKKNSQEQS